MKKILLILTLAVSIILSSCFEDRDDVLQTASTQEIQNFIYRGLNFFYLHKADTPELANDAFADDTAKNAFLNTFDSPESLFDFLLSSQDRFSVLVSDYNTLIDALNGTTFNNGMKFGLVFYPDDSGNVFGYVRYVLPNSDAEAKGVQRGMIFNTVNNQQLTEANFRELLEQNSYSIGLATFDGTTITPTGESIDLQKTNYTENPVYITRTYTIEGVKVGYLMYNGFTRDFVSQLNDAFGQFKAEGVTRLIIDLRYNGGGAVETATDMASMITGQFNGQVFYTEHWNEDRQEQYAENGTFDNTITGGATTNSLNLNDVYFLTTGRTASASELVINGLKPYINVTQIGTNTTGKFQASFLLFDAPAPSFSLSQANPTHTYAMLPLVFKTANASGTTDYVDGLFPDIELFEDYSNLGTLGDITEPLLAAALNDMFPGRFATPKKIIPFKIVNENAFTHPTETILLAN